MLSATLSIIETIKLLFEWLNFMILKLKFGGRCWTWTRDQAIIISYQNNGKSIFSLFIIDIDCHYLPAFANICHLHRHFIAT
ncbi:hypothetical protein YY13_12000 [Salmonella enterica subsp. arizonae]|nr:hypothetical protein [Salmonella enterica subsp. arizonae]ECF7019724.1 hypothetical protein [Salmonella enterica subsp. arizonae]ECJ4464451.1 hypothetical protein [Salmonella enterica subsp. arizonae]